MGECINRFSKGFKVDVHIVGITLEEAARIKAYVDNLKKQRGKYK